MTLPLPQAASDLPTPPPQATDGLPTPQRYWAMLAIAIGIVMAVLDASVANVALPNIAKSLGASPSAAVWIVNSYQLMVLATLLPLAALGEHIGYARVFVAGLVLFIIGSLACACSTSLPLLVAARALQGLGGSGLMAVNGALVRFTYPQARLGRGIGLNSLVVALSSAAGPTLASLILSLATWPWLFAVNVPFGLFNLGVALWALPRSPLIKGRVDGLGAILSALAFILLFLGCDGITHAAHRMLAAGEIGCGMVAGAALARHLSGRARPLIPLDLLKIPAFAWSVAASICAFVAFGATFIVLPFHFENDLHLSQVQTGLLITAWPIALALIAPVAGRLSDDISPTWLGAAGMAVVALALLLLAWLPAQAALADVAWRIGLGGLGFALFQSPNNRMMLSTAPRERAGAAGGMLATARLIGMTAGAMLAGALFHVAPGSAAFGTLVTGAVLAAVAGAISLLR